MEMQLLGSIPTPYIEIGGGVLAFVVLSVVFLVRRRKIKAQEPHVESPATTVPPAQTPSVSAPKAPPPRAPSFFSKIESLILGAKEFNESFLESLEELLYTGDLGPKTVNKLLAKLKESMDRGELSDLQKVKTSLYGEISEILSQAPVQKPQDVKPHVILIVGVNGVGKTTSIGKLAHYFSNQNKSVLVVAGDTFRAAAKEQLAVWGQRANVNLFTSEQTKDPAAVAFQGVQKGVAESTDVIIIDTAGRLHTKENLMDELKKIKRVLNKALPGAPHEVILVIDANSGQNARLQTQQFKEAVGVTSLIATKFDGTARGGVLVSIADEEGVSAQFVGTGEKINDFAVFSQEDYVKNLLQM